MLFPAKAAIEFEGAVHLDSTPGICVAPDISALLELAAD
jgi:hypothetical protein